MAGVFDHLHVRKNTSGSSNELSFDVLEAARYELDGKDSRNARQSASLPKSSQGSYHGVEGTSTLSSQPEVARRKKKRRAAARRAWILAVLAVCAVLGVSVYAGLQYKANTEEFEVGFDRLIADFEQVDALLSEVDALMVNPLDATDDERARQKKALDQIPAALKTVEDVKAQAQGATGQAVNDQDSIALAQVVTAADARIAMLEAAKDAFTTSTSAAQQISGANDAWAAVLAADQKAREATAIANAAATEDETVRARDLTQQSRGDFEQARSALQEIARANPKADFSAQDAYLEKKIEALGYAVATSEALLDGNRDEALRQNQLYNEADAQAAELAQALPPSVEGGIRDAIDEQLSASLSAYEAARNQAISSDATIRSYVQS